MPHISVDGIRVHYLKEGNGPAVLLLQGVGVIGEGWRPQIEGLRGGFTLIAPDNRGMGGSEFGKPPLSIASMAADALAIMDAEGIRQFHVVGHSMGGLLAQQIALSAPHRLLSLSFLCTFAHGKQAVSLSLAMIVTGLRTRIGTRRMRRHAFLSLVMNPRSLSAANKDELAERLANLFGHDLADQPPVVMKQLRAMARYDVRDALKSLAHIPTLVCSASDDRIARVEYGRELAAAIPGARFIELKDAAHGVPIEQAAMINEILQGHFATSSEKISDPPILPS